MQENPFETSTAKIESGTGPANDALELRAPQQMQILVPGAVALGGLMACLILNFLPSSTSVMKLAGGLVLLSDLLIAAFLAKMFASRLVRADKFGLSVRGPGGGKTVPWTQVASYEQVSGQSGAYLSVRDAAGQELVKIESFLGTKEQREQLAALLDSHVTR